MSEELLGCTFFCCFVFRQTREQTDDVRCGQPLCQAGSCCHLLAPRYVQVERFFLLHFFPWKISRVKTHWKEMMHLLLSQEGFFIYGFRSSHSSLNTHGPYYCTIPFFSLSLFLQQSCSVLTVEPGEDQMPLPCWNSQTVRTPELTRSFMTLLLN